MQNQKIVILGTGGTIAGRAADPLDNLGYTAAEVGVDQLVAAIPSLAAMSGVVTEQAAQLDSKDMTFEVWVHLARRVAHFLAQDDVQGIVITHGTDTLEETAYFLQLLLQPSKPVVLTCAMRPATSLSPDGPQNVLDAVAAAQDPALQGVVVACAGKLHSAEAVQKVHTYQVDAFSSGDCGPLAYIEEGRLRWAGKIPAAPVESAPRAIKNIAYLGDGSAWPAVEIVMNYAGAGAGTVNALVAAGVKGLVVAGTGNGSLHHALEAALLKAQADGVKVVRATRCLNGRVLAKPDDVLADSKGLSPVKARVAMLLSLLAA